MHGHCRVLVSPYQCCNRLRWWLRLSWWWSAVDKAGRGPIYRRYPCKILLGMSHTNRMNNCTLLHQGKNLARVRSGTSNGIRVILVTFQWVKNRQQDHITMPIPIVLQCTLTSFTIESRGTLSTNTVIIRIVPNKVIPTSSIVETRKAETGKCVWKDFNTFIYYMHIYVGQVSCFISFLHAKLAETVLRCEILRNSCHGYFRDISDIYFSSNWSS